MCDLPSEGWYLAHVERLVLAGNPLHSCGNCVHRPVLPLLRAPRLRELALPKACCDELTMGLLLARLPWLRVLAC